MAWLKWHIGASSDPKFRLIAKKAHTSIPAVLGVWLMLLERAAEAGGDISGFDPEVAEIALGLKEGKVAAIVAVMAEKGMIDDNQITAWEERQGNDAKGSPKSGAERAREHRARQKALREQANPASCDASVTVCNEGVTDVTPCNVTCNDGNESVTASNGDVTDVTPCNALKEENRIDKIKEIKNSSLRSEFSAELSCDSSPEQPKPPEKYPPADAFIFFPLNTGAMHPVLRADMEHWQQLYPAMDVPQELRKMRGWLEGNPKKRKTKNGVGRFVNAWLAKEQNRGGNQRASPQNRPAAPTVHQQAIQTRHDYAEMLWQMKYGKNQNPETQNGASEIDVTPGQRVAGC